MYSHRKGGEYFSSSIDVIIFNKKYKCQIAGMPHNQEFVIIKL